MVIDECPSMDEYISLLLFNPDHIFFFIVGDVSINTVG